MSPLRSRIVAHCAPALALTLLLLATAACQPAPGGPAAATPGAANADATEAPAANIPAGPPSDILVYAWQGEPESLDPHWSYESQGLGIAANLYDGLVGFKQGSPDDFVPALATEWELSDDQLTYTFKLRPGVKFHSGGTLEPHDVAYTLQRGMLQDRSNGPMWLLLKPILGTSSIEALAIAEAGIEPAADGTAPTLADVPAEALAAACQKAKDAVVADDAAGTVTIRLAAATPWFLQLMAAPFGAIFDQEWQVEQGDWDGDCATWAQWHGPAAEKSPIFDKANGTGPYSLDSWKKGESITLLANDGYWRAEPAWEGGPSGPPAIKTVVIQKVSEWGTRLTKLQAGDADIVDVPRDQIVQVADMVYKEYLGKDESAPSEVVNEDGMLKVFRDYPTMWQEIAQFNFAINAEGGNEFIGSGQLDGAGIPPDFFSDIHVRRGFSYCFDWDAYLKEAQQSEAVQSRGPIAKGLSGYAEDSPVYARDIEKCREELAQAWDGQLPETGFSLSVAYNEGGTARQIAGQILAAGLQEANPKYKVDTVKLEWPTMLDNMNQRRLPITFAGWYEDYHDASNWVHPYMHAQSGAYAPNQGFPPDTAEKYTGLVDQALAETDAGKREAIYRELQQLAHDDAIDLFLAQMLGRTYMRREVNGWFFSPLQPSFVYYNLSKGAE